MYLVEGLNEVLRLYLSFIFPICSYSFRTVVGKDPMAFILSWVNFLYDFHFDMYQVDTYNKP